MSRLDYLNEAKVCSLNSPRIQAAYLRYLTYLLNGGYF
jgi:hypothetical protein